MLAMLKLASNLPAPAVSGNEPPDINNTLSWFDSDVPDGFLQDVVIMLFEHYAARDQHMARFAHAERHDLWPHTRRALIEGDFRRLAHQHGLGGGVESNVRCNANHTVVTAGRVDITQSYVDLRSDLPRPAHFRKTLTQASQFLLFARPEQQPDQNARVYAILTHGTRGDDSSQPGFADILFPAMEGEQVVLGGKIRLFEDRFADLVAQYRPAATPEIEPEVIKDDVEPRFREEREEGTGG